MYLVPCTKSGRRDNLKTPNLTPNQCILSTMRKANVRLGIRCTPTSIHDARPVTFQRRAFEELLQLIAESRSLLEICFNTGTYVPRARRVDERGCWGIVRVWRIRFPRNAYTSEERTGCVSYAPGSRVPAGHVGIRIQWTREWSHKRRPIMA